MKKGPNYLLFTLNLILKVYLRYFQCVYEKASHNTPIVEWLRSDKISIRWKDHRGEGNVNKCVFKIV